MSGASKRARERRHGGSVGAEESLMSHAPSAERSRLVIITLKRPKRKVVGHHQEPYDTDWDGRARYLVMDDLSCGHSIKSGRQFDLLDERERESIPVPRTYRHCKKCPEGSPDDV